MNEIVGRVSAPPLRAESEREQAWVEIEHQLSRFEGSEGIEMPGEFLIGVGTKWIGSEH